MTEASGTGNPASGPQGNQPQSDRPTQMGPGYVMGHLCDDPELRYTPSGQAVTKMRVAFTPRYRDEATGQWKDGETEFYTVNAWRRQAEHCAEHLQRGDRVVAAGNWTSRTWTTREGEERTSVELTAYDIGPSLLFKPAHVYRESRRGPASFTQQAGPPAQQAGPPDSTPDDQWAAENEPPF